MDMVITSEVKTETKTRKKRRASRFMLLRCINPGSKAAPEGELVENPCYEVISDNHKSAEDAVKAGEQGECQGHILVVCVHREGDAVVEKQTAFKWGRKS